MLKSLFRFIKKLLLIVLCLLAIMIGALFAYENPEKISPIVFGYSLPSLSLGLYLAFILLCGVCMGLMLSFWGSQSKLVRIKVENNRLKKNLKQAALENSSTATSSGS